MEITLEKIELVKDRTGVTYKEAKDALEQADGNVVDAIIRIEDSIDEQSSPKKIGKKGQEILDKMKEIVHRGNITKIVILKDERVLMSLPVNVGVAGVVIAPWAVIVGVLAAFGFRCQIQMVKDDGSIIDLTDKAGNLYDEARTKGSKVYDGLKDKAPGFYETVKDVGSAAKDKASKLAEDAAGKIRSGKDDFDEDFFDEEDGSGAFHEENDGVDFSDVSDLKEKADSRINKAVKKAKEAGEKVKSTVKKNADAAAESEPAGKIESDPAEEEDTDKE